MDNEKSVDESWKEISEKQKEALENVDAGSNEESVLHIKEPIKESDQDDSASAPLENFEQNEEQQTDMPEINFINYVTSLGFQVLIFLGEIPSPVTNQHEKNLNQAKFLIDTLVMLRDKTKGNLDSQEDNLLNASVYELQMKYVERVKEGGDQPKE